MLTVVPDLAPENSWIQVLGRISVHGSAGAKRLTESGQRLLAVLAAAGPSGASAERIAEEIWADAQPDPWRPALRMAIARLRKQLPADWGVVSTGGFYAITTGAGWIDAWRLEEIASAGQQIEEADLPWLLGGEPFPDVDLLELVGSSTQRLRMLQISVAERFCSQDRPSIDATTCRVLTALVGEHPYNDRLAMTVGRALAGFDRQTEALLMIRAFANTYTSEFGSAPADMATFIATGGGHGDTISAQSLSRRRTHKLPKELRSLIEMPMLGRERERAALLAAENAIVTGAIGSGKSRLLAELTAHDQNIETVYVVGDERADFPLGPFAVAMPELRDDLIAAAQPDPGHDGQTAKEVAATAWPLVLGYLEDNASSAPQRLIVDDAHLLDLASLGLLRLLVRTTTSAALSIVVSGRNDVEDVEWSSLARDVERAGFQAIELEGLEKWVLREMVFAEFPDATVEARHGLANDVHEASAGLPVVAAPLIASADSETLALPDRLTGTSALGRVVATVSEQSRVVAAAAAVLGLQFSIGTLTELSETDEVTMFRVIEELWSSGLVVETSDPDQVRFRHVLIQRAFLEAVPLFRRGQLHLQAAELTDDAHERADHYAHSGVLVEVEKTAQALCESAQLFAERRRWRKVCRELRRVDDLAGQQLDVRSLTLWAGALDRSGADGATVRRRAFDGAMAQEDWVAALDAAMSGLPEAEAPDGDAERISMLESIPEHKLPAERRFERVFQLSRQHSLLGVAHDQVFLYAEQAISMAANADEVGSSHECRWFGTRHIQAQVHEISESVLAAGSLRTRTRLAHINAINLVESGDFVLGHAEFIRFKNLAIELGNPRRIWQSMGNQVMFHSDAAEFAASEAAALRALRFGELHDLQSANVMYAGEMMHSYWLQGRLHEVDLEPFRSNLSSALLGRSALALQANEAGDPNVGLEVRAVVDEALARRGTFSLLSLVLLVPLMREHAPKSLTAVRDLLTMFGTNPLLASFGAANYGPTSRYVAQLTDDPDQKRELLAASVRAADMHGQLVWRIHSRLDSDEPHAHEEARVLSLGTELEDMVAQLT